MAAGVTQPLFDGFTLLNKQKAAEAGLTQAEAQYRQSVITAFQNVSDALRALQADGKAVKAAVYAEQVAKKNLEIVKKQLQVGSVNVLAMLNAEQHICSRRCPASRPRAIVFPISSACSWRLRRLEGSKPEGSPRNGSEPSTGFDIPSNEQIDKIQDGPVNSSWFPSFWD